MDNAVVLNKLESLRRCLHRVQEKTPATFAQLADNHDLQDIIVLNLERAVQLCVDIGLHIVSTMEAPAPDTMANTFVTLHKYGYLDDATAQRMIKAVGFRNTAVHAYQAIDWLIVYHIITGHLDDFRNFARQMLNLLEQQ